MAFETVGDRAGLHADIEYDARALTDIDDEMVQPPTVQRQLHLQR